MVFEDDGQSSKTIEFLLFCNVSLASGTMVTDYSTAGMSTITPGVESTVTRNTKTPTSSYSTDDYTIADNVADFALNTNVTLVSDVSTGISDVNTLTNDTLMVSGSNKTDNVTTEGTTVITSKIDNVTILVNITTDVDTVLNTTIESDKNYTTTTPNTTTNTSLFTNFTKLNNGTTSTNVNITDQASDENMTAVIDTMAGGDTTEIVDIYTTSNNTIEVTPNSDIVVVSNNTTTSTEVTTDATINYNTTDVNATTENGINLTTVCVDNSTLNDTVGGNCTGKHFE